MSRDIETRIFRGRRKASAPVDVMCLGIIWHPDISRVGDILPLTFEEDKVLISRTAPDFVSQGSLSGHPLSHIGVSRKPFQIKRLSTHSVEISAPDSPMQVTVNGRTVSTKQEVSFNELGDEIIIGLSHQVVLALFYRPLLREDGVKDTGLVGISGVMDQVRRTIKLAAPTRNSVMITGATGTGKELVATAIHHLSGQPEGPLVAVNMSTLAPEMAAAELFGAARGAYTGATSDRVGLFQEATGGTLFLDEIGSCPTQVQPMLLRALETNEYRRVGEVRVRKSHARVVAATDQPLTSDHFNQPLLQRLSTVSIDLPSLNRRRVDIGLLIRHFTDRLATDRERALTELSSGMAEQFALHDWPGNVRELKNALNALSLGMEPKINIDVTSREKRKKNFRHRSDVTDDEVLEALDACDWQIKAAAEYLNISRTSFYDLLKGSAVINTPEKITKEDLSTVLQQGKTVSEIAKIFRVPREALKRYLRELGL